MPPDFENWMVEISKKVNDIHTFLFGIKETKTNGFVGDFGRLQREHAKLANRVWLIIVFLAGTGAGTGIWQILR